MTTNPTVQTANTGGRSATTGVWSQPAGVWLQTPGVRNQLGGGGSANTGGGRSSTYREAAPVGFRATKAYRDAAKAVFYCVAAGVLLLTAVPHADAKRPRRAAAPVVQKFGDVTKLPADKAQSLVDSVKIPGFYDPANLGREPVISAKAAVLMDAATGEIVYAKSPDAVLFPASTTKILTGLVFAERTEPGDIVTATNPKIRDVEPSSLHIQPWEKFTSRDLLYGTMLRSGNDGCVVIAEHVSGSVPRFADVMNERAAELGATNTHFTNPHGLPDPDHTTTAHDLAVITRAALQNVRFADAVGQRRRVISRTKSKDVVVASKAKKFYETFPGANGVKTGYTRAAGHCFVGSATRNGRQLIGVILGAKDNASGETATVLGWGYRRFPTVIALKAGASAPPVAVPNGAKPQVLTVTASDLVTFSDATKPGDVVQTVAIPNTDLAPPIVRGQEVGRVVARVGGVDRGSVALLADEDVDVAPVVAVVKKAGDIFGVAGKIVPWIMGAGAVCLIGLVLYGTKTTKSTRRRRGDLAPQSRGVDSRRTGRGERRDDNGAGNKR